MTFPMRGPGQGRSAFAELDRLRDEVSRIISSTLAGTRWTGFGGGGLRGWSQDVQVDESDDEWTVTVRLPGVAAEEVQVELEERELRVRARHVDEDEPVRARGAFHYRLTVPSNVDVDNVDATMDHGLLVLRLPRVRGTGPRQINVRSGTGWPAAPGPSVPSTEEGTGTGG